MGCNFFSLTSIVPIALSLALTASCGGDKSADNNPSIIVYAVGSDASNMGVVWKNGVVIKKTTFMAHFQGVYVSNGVVYAVGTELSYDRAFMWRSNDPNYYHFFGESIGWAVDIHGDGDNVYLVGGEEDTGKVWNANTAREIHNLGQNARPLSIYVSETDIYSAGWLSDYGAAVWRGDVPVDYGTPYNYEFSSISGSGDDVYAVGTTYENRDDEYAVWLKVGGDTGKLGSGMGRANSVHVSGSDVYIAGVDEVTDTTEGSGKIWRGNTSGTNFTTHIDLGSNIVPQVVQVLGNNVYTLAHGFRNDVGFKVYRDRTPIYTFTPGAYPFSMFVVAND